MKDTIIIGAGISGLYLGMKFKNENRDFLILEQKGRIGGRIKSIKIKDDLIYDSGALRIHDSHKLVLKLIKDLNLTDDLVDFSCLKKKYFINGKFINNKTNKELYEILNISKKIKKKDRSSNTVKAIAYKHIGKKSSDLACIKLGYDSEFKNFNFDNFCDSYKNYNGKFYRLNNGLSTLCYTIEEMIKKNIIKYTKLVDIKYNKSNKIFTLITTTKNYKCKNLILTMPKNNLLKIPYLSTYSNYFNSVVQNNYMRVFAVYPKVNNKYWFEDFDKIITDLPIRKISVICKKKGLIQITYNDDENAKYLNYFNINNELYKFIEQNLKILFPRKKIPKPTYLRAHYWDFGTHYWKANINSSKMINEITQLDKSQNMYVCGETYSNNQAWIDGALNSCENLLKLLNRKKIIKKWT